MTTPKDDLMGMMGRLTEDTEGFEGREDLIAAYNLQPLKNEDGYSTSTYVGWSGSDAIRVTKYRVSIAFGGVRHGEYRSRTPFGEHGMAEANPVQGGGWQVIVLAPKSRTVVYTSPVFQTDDIIKYMMDLKQKAASGQASTPPDPSKPMGPGNDYDASYGDWEKSSSPGW